MAFKHISLLWSAKSVIMCHVGDTAFLPVQKTHITRSRGWYGIFVFGPRADMGVSGWYGVWYENCHIITSIYNTSDSGFMAWASDEGLDQHAHSCADWCGQSLFVDICLSIQGDNEGPGRPARRLICTSVSSNYIRALFVRFASYVDCFLITIIYVEISTHSLEVYIFGEKHFNVVHANKELHCFILHNIKGIYAQTY